MASRIPKFSSYPGHPILGVANLLAPPPPPPPLPAPVSSPAPQRYSGNQQSFPFRHQSPAAMRQQPGSPYSFSHNVQQPSRLPIIEERDTEASPRLIPRSMPSGGFKRPLQSPCAGPGTKKMKNEDVATNKETSVPAVEPVTKQEGSSVSNGSEGANTPRRSQMLNEVFLKIKNPLLPKELSKMFGALKCDLCEISVNSTVQAKMHYIGKTHDKKVNAFLINWCKETGEPMPNISKDGQLVVKKPTNPEDSFCKVCNLILTSLQHAQQHYMGRNHQRALNGHIPLKNRYFNKETGKIERSAEPIIDPTGRFGIGSGFVGGVGQGFSPKSTDPLGLLEPEASTSTAGVSEETSSKALLKNRRFFCDLCQIAATSQDQLDMHLKGAKHRKAEKLKATNVNNLPKPQQPTIPLPSAPSDSILASVIRVNKADKNKSGIKDYSIFRTPSGQFYCQPCNLTLNSESQFSQHCESKKHKLAILKKPINKGVGKDMSLCAKSEDTTSIEDRDDCNM